MKKEHIYRGGFYVAGLLILALGIILNTKSGLGVSPIISVAYSISTIWELNFGNTTFLLYTAFVLVEIVIHLARKEKLAILLLDALQLPLSLIFTRFMNLFSAWLPTAGETFLSKLPVLLAGIVLTGIGAAMSLNMRIIPNPGDGIVQALADCAGKPVGLTKNCFDLFNICITISVSLIFTGHLVGIGLGTVLAVIGVGRVIAAFNHFCMEKMLAAAKLA